MFATKIATAAVGAVSPTETPKLPDPIPLVQPAPSMTDAPKFVAGDPILKVGMQLPVLPQTKTPDNKEDPARKDAEAKVAQATKALLDLQKENKAFTPYIVAHNNHDTAQKLADAATEKHNKASKDRSSPNYVTAQQKEQLFKDSEAARANARRTQALLTSAGEDLEKAVPGGKIKADGLIQEHRDASKELEKFRK